MLVAVMVFLYDHGLGVRRPTDKIGRFRGVGEGYRRRAAIGRNKKDIDILIEAVPVEGHLTTIGRKIGRKDGGQAEQLLEKGVGGHRSS